MNKENLYLGYIDNELSEVSEKELEALLASEGEQAKNELFEIKDIADTVTVQYGGSMNAKNADELLDKINVDGGLIGGASLKAEDFSIIVKAASK